MNYLYLKPSSDSPKVGDLTTEGLITDISPDGDGFIIQGDKKLDVCELAMLHMDIKILTPLLIMDAPDNIMQSFLNNQGKIGAIIFFDEGKIIPFHSNEQVFEYLKSKGIKPEAEMLIEFDGEVEIELEPLPANFKIRCEHCLDAGFFGNTPCKWCNYGGEFRGIPKDENHPVQLARKKIAIIKEKQEGCEDIDLIKHYENWCKGTKRNGGILIGSSIREFLIDLQQHFKIERR